MNYTMNYQHFNIIDIGLPTICSLGFAYHQASVQYKNVIFIEPDTDHGLRLCIYIYRGYCGTCLLSCNLWQPYLPTRTTSTSRRNNETHWVYLLRPYMEYMALNTHSDYPRGTLEFGGTSYIKGRSTIRYYLFQEHLFLYELQTYTTP